MQQPSLSSAQPHSRLYPPSWVDGLQGFLERLPWPVWLNYAALWLLLAAVETLLKWKEGPYPVGSFFAFHIVFAGTGLDALAFIHYLDGAAARALNLSQGALELSSEQLEELRYRLTTMPRGGALLATLVGILLALLHGFTFGNSNLAGLGFATSGLDYGFELVFLRFFLWGIGAVVVYHTVRQLRIVDLLYQQWTHISLLHIRPLYAFSGFSARTGAGILLIGYAWLATYPGGIGAALGNRLFSAGMGLLESLAVLCFVWPLWGLHHRLELEKQRHLAEVNQRLEAVLKEQHKRLDANDYSELAGIEKAINTTTAERSLIEKVSTWPWQLSTLRGFLTAVFLPLFLWAAQQFLGRLVAP